MSTLYHNRKLIRPFLRFLKVSSIPPLKFIEIGIQGLPGQEQLLNQEKQGSVPDAYFCDKESWAVIIESKVQAGISNDQLRRHQQKAINYGYVNNVMVLIAVNPPEIRLPKVMYVTWKSVYKWFVAKISEAPWAMYFVDYMEVYESKMLAQNYNIKGTLTMFSGFHFTKELPYTYREGKRLIKVLGQEFRTNKRLVDGLGIDPEREGRPAITQEENGGVWDFIYLKKAASKNFTSYPHATIGIRPTNMCVAITIPNAINGGVKTKLKNKGRDKFYSLLEIIERNLHTSIGNVSGARPLIYLDQKYYKSQKSQARTDGIIKVDLRTLVDKADNGLKHQPMWTEAIFNLLTNKKTNMQFGVEVEIPFSAHCMQSDKAIDVMVDAWIALKPIIDHIMD
jgi:hypothetical protein